MKGLEQSMNPQLIKYSQETEASITLDRKKNRKRLFRMHLSQSKYFSLRDENNSEPYGEKFNKKIFIKCENLTFKLQVAIHENETPYQIEPYFTTLSVFDARNNRKLCENFYFDVNHDYARRMVLKNFESLEDNNEIFKSSSTIQVKRSWLENINQAVFNVSDPHSEIFLVLRIDKILQANVNQICEAYVKAGKDPRLGTKTFKQITSYFQR